MLAVFLFFLFGVNIREVRANNYIFKGLVSLNSQNLNGYYDNLNQARLVSINPIDPIILLGQGYPDVVYRLSSQATGSQLNQLQPELTARLKEVIANMEKVMEDDPLNVYNHFVLCNLYNEAAFILRDAQYLNKSLALVNQARRLAPNRLDIIWLEARTYASGGLYTEALKALDQSIALNDKLPYPYWVKYLIYAKQNKKDLAFQNSTLAIKKGYTFTNSADVLGLLPHYEQTKEIGILEVLYGNLINFSPKEFKYYEKLIEIYKQKGETDKMDELLKKLPQPTPTSSNNFSQPIK
jgi:tetratricopeptide (TPR) repeat protein